MPEEKYKSPEAHYFPGGWTFFSSFGGHRPHTEYFGAFFTTEIWEKPSHNIYHNSHENADLPITAILIPY